MSKFNIDLYSVAITTNVDDGKIYILSTKPDEISFPLLELTNSNLNTIDNDLVEYMRKFLMTHPLELSPQLMTINSADIQPRKKNTINVVYAFLVKEGIKNFDSYWINFDYHQVDAKYAGLIFRIIQKLK